MFRIAALSLCLVVALASTGAANKEESRLETSGVVLEEVLGVPDSIPQELLDMAECVISDSIDAESRHRSRWQLRPRRDGVPHRPRLRWFLGRTPRCMRSMA